jgi:predicted DNA-binding transcriptional regulator YafY
VSVEFEFAYVEHHKRVKFGYTNYRGEPDDRMVMVSGVWFGTSPWYPEPQWFMRAWDAEKREYRDFAMRDMTGVKDA